VDSFLNRGKDKNPLTPKTIIPSPPLDTDSLSSFVLEYKQRNYLRAIMLILDADPKGKRSNDSIERGRYLAKMLKPEHDTVRMMDGHGRIFFHFCLAVIELYGNERLNKLCFEIVDIDAQVNRYHEKLFVGNQCKNVKCINQNIFTRPHSSSVLLYLNFCGIGGQDGQANAGEYLKFLKACPSASVLISWSRARSAKKDTANVLRGHLNGVASLKFIKTGRSRKEFVTYLIESRPQQTNCDKNPRPLQKRSSDGKKRYVKSNSVYAPKAPLKSGNPP